MLVTNNSLIRSNDSVNAYTVHTCCVSCSLDYLNSQLVSKSRLHVLVLTRYRIPLNIVLTHA